MDKIELSNKEKDQLQKITIMTRIIEASNRTDYPAPDSLIRSAKAVGQTAKAFSDDPEIYRDCFEIAAVIFIMDANRWLENDPKLLKRRINETFNFNDKISLTKGVNNIIKQSERRCDEIRTRKTG